MLLYEWSNITTHGLLNYLTEDRIVYKEPVQQYQNSHRR